MTDCNLKAAEDDADRRAEYYTLKTIEAAKVAAEDGLENLDFLPVLQDPAREAALTEAYQALEAAVSALAKALEANQ